MSIDATRWAWKAPVKNSSQRLVLLSLADRAGEEHTAWPGIERLAKDTALNDKTVQKVLLELIKSGLVIDTGERKGPTKRTKVLKLNGVKGREECTQKQDDLNSKKDSSSDANTPKNGDIKQSQKRNDSNNGNNPESGTLLPIENIITLKQQLTNNIKTGEDEKAKIFAVTTKGKRFETPAIIEVAE